MRHHNKNRKFGRSQNQRHALLKSLMTSLIRDEKIVTTEAKARELRPHIERIVTHAKTDTLAKRRFVVAKLGSKEMTAKLFADISPKYKERAGGYTRIIKLPLRPNGAVKMAQIEFV